MGFHKIGNAIIKLSLNELWAGRGPDNITRAVSGGPKVIKKIGYRPNKALNYYSGLNLGLPSPAQTRPILIPLDRPKAYSARSLSGLDQGNF